MQACRKVSRGSGSDAELWRREEGAGAPATISCCTTWSDTPMSFLLHGDGETAPLGVVGDAWPPRLLLWLNDSHEPAG